MLKIRYRYLKTYLKQIGKTASDLYCCRIRETADHLLISCKEYSCICLEKLKASWPMSQILGEKDSPLEVIQFI